MIRAVVAVAAVLALMNAATAQPSMVEDCENRTDVSGSDPDAVGWHLMVVGCTAVIQSGQWEGANLAWAYNNRGVAYGHLGQYERAIEDYDQAIRLNPGQTWAYHSRAMAHCVLGHAEEALQDYRRTIHMPDGLTREAVQQRLIQSGYHWVGDGYPGHVSIRYMRWQQALEAWIRDGCL